MNTCYNRRHFLKASLLALAITGDHESRLLEARPLGIPIGLELFTVRNECQQDFAGTLQKVAAIGYKEVEYFDFYGLKAVEVRRLLSSIGLVAPSSHTRSYLLNAQDKLSEVRSRWEKPLAYAAELGVRYVGFNIDVSELHPLEDCKRLAESINALGEQCRQAGLQFTLHNRNMEFREFNGVVPYDWILAHTDPRTVQLEIDCYWTTRTGRDPVDYFKKYPGRTPLLHIKDRKPGYPPSTVLDSAGPFTEVGRGTIDWARILAAAPRGGLRHYFVEQDYCDGPVFESVKTSYDYLRRLTVHL